MFARRLFAGLIVAMFAAPAFADIITYRFEGVLAQVRLETQPLGIFAGDVFSGTFTYDSTVPDIDPRPDIGFYEQPIPGGPFRMTLELGGYMFDTNDFVVSPGEAYPYVFNDNHGGDCFGSYLEGGSTDDWQFGQWDVWHADDSGTLTDNDFLEDIPRIAVSGDSIGVLQFEAYPIPEIADGDVFIEAYGSLTSFEFVPAPGAALLALVGIPMVDWIRRRFA